MNMNISNNFLPFAFSLAQSITSTSIPTCFPKKPPHWNNDSLSFVLEIFDNYIHSLFIAKNNILIDNLAKANVPVQLCRS